MSLGGSEQLKGINLKSTSCFIGHIALVMKIDGDFYTGFSSFLVVFNMSSLSAPLPCISLVNPTASVYFRLLESR